jgi:hypothetical protein
MCVCVCVCMCLCPRFRVVLSCVGRRLASGWSPVQGVLPNFLNSHKFQKLKFWIGTGLEADDDKHSFEWHHD